MNPPRHPLPILLATLCAAGCAGPSGDAVRDEFARPFAKLRDAADPAPLVADTVERLRALPRGVGRIADTAADDARESGRSSRAFVADLLDETAEFPGAADAFVATEAYRAVDGLRNLSREGRGIDAVVAPERTFDRFARSLRRLASTLRLDRPVMPDHADPESEATFTERFLKRFWR
jgi:hypothetical protein